MFSCKSPKQDGKSEIETESLAQITLSEKETILINSDWNEWLSKHYGYKQWEPNIDNILSLNSFIDKAINNQEFDFIKEPIKENIQKYYRQYIPYINKKGERIIEINAFCEILELPPLIENNSNEWTKMDWKKEAVMVDDGGSCYWQMKVNLNTKKYSELSANGPG